MYLCEADTAPKNFVTISQRGLSHAKTLDSPTQIEFSFGSDGQIQTDWVAVRVIFVGAAERFTGGLN